MMSKRLKKTRLFGGDFPTKDKEVRKAVEELRKVLENKNFFPLILDQLTGRRKGEMSYRTGDNYAWHWGNAFGTDAENAFFLLIPCACDEKMRDGSRFDRAIAVYTFRNPKTKDIVSKIKELTETFRKNLYDKTKKKVKTG